MDIYSRMETMVIFAIITIFLPAENHSQWLIFIFKSWSFQLKGVHIPQWEEKAFNPHPSHLKYQGQNFKTLSSQECHTMKNAKVMKGITWFRMICSQIDQEQCEYHLQKYFGRFKKV